MVKHKSKYICKSMIYFNLSSETIKVNCKFNFYYNKTDIIPTVLYRGKLSCEIILANWPNDKHIICNINNDIPIKIPSHPYVLVNRSVLCNCGIEVEDHFLLESLAACQDTHSKLIMHFTVKTAFVNYLDQFPNLPDPLEFLIIRNKMTFDITPTVLYRGKLSCEIILANWPNDKHIICNINNDIPIKIPSHPYVLVNRSVLCNCGIEVEDHFLLESLAACQDTHSKLIMHFTVKTAFVNYLDQFPNLPDPLEFLIIRNKMIFEQVLPISLNITNLIPPY